MLRLSTLILFLSSLLVAQTDIIVRKLIIRDAADSAFWTLSQDLATPDTTTILLKDEDDNLRMDWDAQDGVKFYNHILPGTDSTYNIGESGTNPRFQFGFADVWNAEILEITNINDVWGVHNRHWSIFQDPATTGGVLETLLFKDTGGVEIIEIGSSQSGSAWGFLKIKGSVLTWAGSASRNIGSATNGWFNIYLDGAILPENSVTTVDLGSESNEFDDGWFNDNLFVDDKLIIRDSSEDNRVVIDTSMNQAGTIRLFDHLNASRVLFFINANAGTVELASTNGTLTAILEGNSRVAGTSGYLQLRDDSGVINVALGDGKLELIGETAGTGEGAELIGIVKDNSKTIEADNFSISDDGNFYNRIFSGSDINCTDVDDGWTGFRTDTDEIQICRGGAVKVIALAAP